MISVGNCWLSALITALDFLRDLLITVAGAFHLISILANIEIYHTIAGCFQSVISKEFQMLLDTFNVQFHTISMQFHCAISFVAGCFHSAISYFCFC